jgi:hypothetical protein
MRHLDNVQNHEASALQIFNDLPVIPMQAGASRCLTVPRYHDRDAKRLEPEPILFERGKKMPVDADMIEMCTSRSNVVFAMSKDQ